MCGVKTAARDNTSISLVAQLGTVLSHMLQEHDGPPGFRLLYRRLLRFPVLYSHVTKYRPPTGQTREIYVLSLATVLTQHMFLEAGEHRVRFKPIAGPAGVTLEVIYRTPITAGVSRASAAER